MSRNELQDRLERAERRLKDQEIIVSKQKMIVGKRDDQIAELKDKLALIKKLVLNIGSLCGMIAPFRKDSRSWANKIMKRTVDGRNFFSNESLDLAASTNPSDDLLQDNFPLTKPTELFLVEPYIMDRETSIDDETLNPHPGTIEENIEQPQNYNQKAEDGKLALRNTVNTTQELRDGEFYSTEGKALQNLMSKQTNSEKNSRLPPVCLPNRLKMDDSPGSSASVLLIHHHESPSMSALPGEHKQDRQILGEMPKLSGFNSDSNSGYSEEGKEPEVLMVFTDITDRSLTSIEKSFPSIPSVELTERSSRERTSRERSSGHPSLYV